MACQSKVNGCSAECSIYTEVTEFGVYTLDGHYSKSRSGKLCVRSVSMVETTPPTL